MKLLLTTLLLVLCCSFSEQTSLSSCDGTYKSNQPPFPGYHSIGFGYDITSGNTKGKAISFETAPKCSFFDQSTQRYETVPRAITLNPNPSYTADSTFVFMSTQKQFFTAASDGKTNGFKTNNDVDVTVSVPEIPVKASTTIPPLFAGSASSVTGHASSLFQRDDRSYGYSFQKRTTIHASITNTTSILSNEAINFIKQLPATYNKDKYMAFFRAYGTHWVKEYQFGGLAIMEAEYMRYAENYQSADAKKKESSAAFSFFYKHMSQHNSLAGENSFTGKMTTSTSFYVTGGTPGSNWVESLSLNPAIIDRGMSKFSVLVKADTRIANRAQIAANLDKGLEDYIATIQANTPPPSPGPQDARFPLVIYLFKDDNEGGARRVVLDSTSSLHSMDFGDTVSSIEIYPGPGYRAYQNIYKQEPAVVFYKDTSYTGQSLLGLVGKVRVEQLKATGLHDSLSSLRFVNATPDAMPSSVSFPYGQNYFHPVPAVVTLYKDDGFRGSYVVVIEDIIKMDDYFHDFNDDTSSLRIRSGNWPSGKHPPKVILYDDQRFAGRSWNVIASGSGCSFTGADQTCNINIDKLRSHDLQDRISSIQVS